MAAQGSILGNAVTRKEDPGLLTGSNHYVDDLDIDAARIVFVRSTMAHASLLEVDISEAVNMPGVLAVYTSDNLEMPAVNQSEFMDPSMNRPPLAVGRVRFVGDIIAAVVAESHSQAVDAAEQVIVDYDPLPANADIEAALADDAHILWEGAENNVCFAIGNEYDGPDVTEGADTVVSERIVTQRLAGVPMEPNGCVAIPEGDSMTFYASTQAAHGLRDGLAPNLGMEPENLRVVAPWVGGGFGPKAGLYIEFILCGKAAQELTRPVRWTEQRGENMLSMAQGRAMVMTADLGVNSDGSIVGLKARVVADAGAYPAIGAILPMLTMQLSQAVYDIPAIDFFAQSVLTNTTVIGAYRGAGRPEATQMVERILDKAANAIGMDPAELRRKNYIQPDAFPLTTLVGANYDSGEYERSLDAVLEASGYADLRAEQARRREANDPMMLGIGVSSYVEVTAPIGLHVEYGSCEINDDGSATIKVGTSSHGQGHDTAFSMIVNDVLGIPMDQVTHVDADTEEVARGSGTLGSRSLQAGGSAIYEASQVVLEKGKQLAASLLEASADDIVVGEGALQVAGVPAKSISWADLATAAVEQEIEGGLAHELDFDGTDATYPFGSHVAVVEIDRETGHVELLRHVAVDDCGTILNPMLVNGQQHGGIAQGIAQALWEHVQYDEDANPVTASLMDYLMPSAAELPSFEVSNTETASPRNPLGAKGIGESGTIGSTPAVHNAVCDAVAHLGIEHVDMPCTPQAVWRALQDA
ncbi:MAG: xanthine dehydrogenase family protein molybdopterin-binding subunit [Acidimicrobiales bacterium]|jgi:carbon-monoxide dehydrogenase large subunit|nr:carbon monoxide dehydrogenase [Actinomycetota bacterium]MCH2628592.1 xanthine dehydrogenase family protein molybdopterin-binding subunit [Acidimicrobiales bacterium]MEC9113157.1 xanthine dehydrogenase family protein molybdopterin-binding subunit [Actinomycetota bacterium]